MTIDELFSIKIEEPDQNIRIKSQNRWDAIAKPLDGLGIFEEMVSRIASIQGEVCPDVSSKALVIMCADNGVFDEGVSQTDQTVTRDVAALMGEHRSSVCSMASGYPLDIYAYDIGIDSERTPSGVIDARIRRGTANFVKVPAMETGECFAAIQTGIDAVDRCRKEGYGIVATGEMGIGNTTTSTAVLCGIMGLSPSDYVGRGAGLSDQGLARKTAAIEKGLELHRGDKKGEMISSGREALEVLRCLGGLDIAALAGVFIGGAIYHVPIVIDGLISAVAGLVADRILPGCRQYMVASHIGREKGMEVILRELSLKPVINADLALGEGTGAVLLFPMLDMAMSLYMRGTSFGDTQIDQYERFDK